ncbi:MAG: flavodoxin family protein [Oscillospiraceae bacterium]|nr:flavodoxin family protein [Oscillospiraceae bacterium]
MAKIIGINGSPRKGGNSAILLDEALRGAEERGAETERVDLYRLNFKGCASCFGCKRLGGPSFGRCALRDDLTAVLDKVLSADGVIVSAPFYFGDVPGMVRNFYERLWFPCLLYSKDGELAYDRRVKVGLIYTQNCPDPDFYKDLIAGHKQTFGWLIGEAVSMVSADTWQYDDYSQYAGTMFDVEHKRRMREEQFPKDRQAAFALGRTLLD